MPDDTAKPLPKAKDVLAGLSVEGSPSGVSKQEREFSRRSQKDSVSSQTAYAHLKGIQDHYWHKGKWSWFLMGTVGLMLVFQSVLLVFVGLEKLNFENYEWLLPALLVQNLGQVIGLAVFAVKYLFSDITGQNSN